MNRRALLVLAVAGTLAVPGVARANCARPVGYALRVEGSTVVVQPWNHAQRGCNGADAMLRQDAATGATVRLADFCQPLADPFDPKPYLDECVPAGTYRYGFETPYACASSACSTSRWEELTVAVAPPAGCTRSGGNPGPTSVAAMGWGGAGQGRLVCEGSSNVDDGPTGCATAPRASGAVLVLDAAALAVGWALLRRRRRA